MESTIKQILREAIIAHREGKLLEADRLYKEVLNSQVNNPEANHNLGVLAVSVGKVEAALPYFKVALESNPKQTQFWLSYIKALIKLEKFNLAKEALKNMKSMNLAADWFDQLDSKLKRLNNPIQSSPLQDLRKMKLMILRIFF